MIPDRHHRHDFSGIQKQRQGPFVDDRSFDRSALVVDTGEGRRQCWIIGIRADFKFSHCFIGALFLPMTCADDHTGSKSVRLVGPYDTMIAVAQECRRGGLSYWPIFVSLISAG